jgi:hypothetical protein
MNDFDRILANQATIMRMLLEILSLLPCDDQEHRHAVVSMLETASSESYEYARRNDHGG